MQIKDLLTLAKLGYKPSEIKEMAELEKTLPDINTEEQKEEPKEEPIKEEPKQEPNKEPEGDNIEEQLKAANDTIAELQKQIKDIQEANRNTDVSGSKETKTTDELIVEAFTNYLS